MESMDDRIEDVLTVDDGSVQVVAWLLLGCDECRSFQTMSSADGG
jgi:hypothetical protein